MIRVLLVDDNPALFNITKLLLEKDGKIVVDICDSAREARENLERKKYDVIVSDYDMPGEDGISFLRSLRESGHPIPFILFTGKGNERVAMEACNAGADYYMTKSGPPQEVFRTLREKVMKTAEKSRPGSSRRDLDPMGVLILGSMSDLVLVLDRQFRIVIANPAAERTFGRALEGLSLKQVSQFLTPESSARLGRALNHPMGETARNPRPGSAGPPLLLEVGTGSEVTSHYHAVIDLLPGPSGAEDFFLIVGRQVASE
jgi:CheY-like chemotaxis protein